MECSRANVGDLLLDDFVQAVATIYSTHDKHRSIWDVWCHALHHAAGIAHQVKIGIDDKKLHEEIADVSLWLFTAVLKLKGEFGQSEGRSETTQESVIRIKNSCSDLLWHKYPNLCPSCSASKIVGHSGAQGTLGLSPCECLRNKPEGEQRDARRKRLLAVLSHSDRIRGEKPTGIDGWQRMFGTIYAANLASVSLTEVALQLMEELGEASDAMLRMYTYKEETFRSGEPNWRQLNLEGQLADVFSRLFALAEKLSSFKGQGSATAEAVRLSEMIWRRYGSEDLRSLYCPFCGKTVCSCKIILVPNGRPMAELLQIYL